ncbi:MAG: YeeE/YedE family protein [Anaerolineales bacterium]|nr:YeeE/YedE family protein [Anaerolineales bacterium]
MKKITRFFGKELWSPYTAGALLGLVAIATVWISDNLLGASGAFENIAGMIGQALAPQQFNNLYFNFIMPPGVTFGVMMLIGLFIGGLIGAATSRTLLWGKPNALNSDEQWKRVFGPQTWKRWLLAFLGAIVLEYAAGIAGGCTSGLAISGGMLLAPAAFVFIAGMFASGILTTLLIYRGRY